MNPAIEKSIGIGFGPRVLSDGEPLKLVMQELLLSGTLLPVGAKLRARHTFQHDEKETVEVVYSFMLPRDAALHQFRIVGQGFCATSKLMPVEKAVKEYEEGIERGSLSTLARAYRDGMVNLTVGNIRPKEVVQVYLDIVAGVESHDDGFRFRFPFTVAPVYHAEARMSAPAPGIGEMELPEDKFGDLVMPTWFEKGKNLHRVGFELCVPITGKSVEFSSPSHKVRVRQGDGDFRISSVDAKDVPNRDLIIDCSCASSEKLTFAGTDSSRKGRFCAVIPSTWFGKRHDEKTRNVVFVLDRSGSMSGSNIEQAKLALRACLAALTPQDQFGIVAFDNQVEFFRRNLCAADNENRHVAEKFLARVDARGGTELAAGLLGAVKLITGGFSQKGAMNSEQLDTGLEDIERVFSQIFEEDSQLEVDRDPRRQPENAPLSLEPISVPSDIFLLTDGQVGETDSIVKKMKALNIRVHCLGIGSASQDRFLALLARHTGGISRFVTANEPIDTAALELFSAVGVPVARDIAVSVRNIEEGCIEPAPSRFVFAGTPLCLYGSCKTKGEGVLEIKWINEEGAEILREIPLPIAEDPLGDTIKLIQGARLITDHEALYFERHKDTAKSDLRRLSREYGLASQAMALVAVIKRDDDRAGQMPKTSIVPVGLPEDVRFRSYFPDELMPKKLCMLRPPVLASFEDMKLMRRAFVRAEMAPLKKPTNCSNIAVLIEADGGLPGKDLDARVAYSILALLILNEEKQQFRLHINKLINFLLRVEADQLDARHAEVLKRIQENLKHARRELRVALPSERDYEYCRGVCEKLASGSQQKQPPVKAIWEKLEKWF